MKHTEQQKRKQPNSGTERQRFQAGLVQLDSGPNQEENLEQIAALVGEAAEQGAKLVILPEQANGIRRQEAELAEAVPGALTEFYARLARTHQLYLHCGSMTERGADGALYNTSLLFSPAGERLASYSKLHLFDVDLPDGTACRESAHLTAGNHITVVKTPLCTMGLSICYDLRFPELYRLMTLSGAELLIVSANFTEKTGIAHWKPLLQARAIENSCYVAAVNQCGQKPQFRAWGHSMLISPWGEVIGELEQQPGLLLAEIDPERITEARSRLPLFQNRREDMYQICDRSADSGRS